MAMFDREQLYTDNNQPRTKSLFSEFGDGPDTILTLGTWNKSYPSLRTLYVSLCADDPSEHTFAETIFGSFEYWSRLREAPFMKKELVDWQAEARAKRESKAFKYLIEEVKNDGKNAYGSAKYILDIIQAEKGKPGKATPKKSQTETAAEITDLTEFIKSRR